MSELSRDGPDRETPGSRFTSHVGFAVIRGASGASPYAEGSDTGDAQAVVASLLDEIPAAETSALGERSAIQGAYGRGASAWIPVLEFALSAAIAGVIGNAAWEQLKTGARQVRNLLRSWRSDNAKVLVSRGAAALVAIQHVVESGESGILDVEAVEEPSAVAGRETPEMNYVGIEPWLVSLVNESRTTRFVVAVDPQGEVLDSMRLPMSEQEAIYGLPPRD